MTLCCFDSLRYTWNQYWQEDGVPFLRRRPEIVRLRAVRRRRATKRPPNGRPSQSRKSRRLDCSLGVAKYERAVDSAERARSEGKERRDRSILPDVVGQKLPNGYIADWTGRPALSDGAGVEEDASCFGRLEVVHSTDASPRAPAAPQTRPKRALTSVGAFQPRFVRLAPTLHISPRKQVVPAKSVEPRCGRRKSADVRRSPHIPSAHINTFRLLFSYHASLSIYSIVDITSSRGGHR
jgi:hypothetical protein